MSKRRHPRVHLHRSIAYQGSCGTGHGTVHDFSPSGCRIHEADAKVHCGLRLTLWISLPDRIEPIEIKPAVVTWTQKNTFGVEFIAPSQEIRTRMKQVYDLLLDAQTAEDKDRVISLPPFSWK